MMLCVQLSITTYVLEYCELLSTYLLVVLEYSAKVIDV